MTLRLTVDTARWRSQVQAVLSDYEHPVPVVKGNGYGFGRARAIAELPSPTPYVAVGTVHELDPATLDALGTIGARPVVLTPTLHAPPSGAPDAILTVGSPAHIAALAPWRGQVLVKLLSSMHRYGGDPSLIDLAHAAGLEVLGVAIHPPLPQTSPTAPFAPDAPRDVLRWLSEIPTDLEVWVSHLSAQQYAHLPTTHRYRHRLGTRLWHGDKSTLSLGAEVLEARPVTTGQPLGYRQVPAPGAGEVVMIGAGSAHGVRTLPDGRSPFHFASRRLALIEPPHMHTSMAFIPTGDPVPEVGDQVDVQHPLTQVVVDQIIWR